VTASWAAYPNTKKYFLQDGSDEATKTSYDKICQNEPEKIFQVKLGRCYSRNCHQSAANLLIDYCWKWFCFSYTNMEVMQRKYLDHSTKSDRFDNTLFPLDSSVT